MGFRRNNNAYKDERYARQPKVLARKKAQKGSRQLILAENEILFVL